MSDNGIFEFLRPGGAYLGDEGSSKRFIRNSLLLSLKGGATCAKAKIIVEVETSIEAIRE